MEVMRRRSARHFRRVLYGLVGVVLSSYVVLFIVVVSRHIDRGARQEASREASAASTQRWPAPARQVARRSRAFACAQPRYRSPPGPMVALASFPGSGNTWIRFLVQQATGILTGSVYRDYSLKRNGFPGESVANGSVLLVKTHEWGEGTRSRFQRAVLLVRQPRGALLAEFHRRAGGHVGHAAPDKFIKGNTWPNFVQTHSKLWMESILDWLQFEGPLLVLRYEDFTTHLPSQLSRLLDFLGVSNSTLQRCVLRHRDGIFRRPRKPLRFDPFSPPLAALLEGYKGVVEAALAYHRLSLMDNSSLLLAGNDSLPSVTYVEDSGS